MIAYHKTRGIVLHLVKFGDTSVIAKIYTEDFGLQSYMVKGVRQKKHKVGPGLFQHLSLLDLDVTHKENSNIQHIKEVKSAYPFQQIPFDIVRSSIALFLNEVIYKSLKEGDPHAELFEFLFTAIQVLDVSSTTQSCFHHWFCLQFAKKLGFFPMSNYSARDHIFDMQEGMFQDYKPQHSNYIDIPYSKFFYDLSLLSHEALNGFTLPNSQRRQLLKIILEYYQLHLQGFKDVKSHEVLEKIMSEE